MPSSRIFSKLDPAKTLFILCDVQEKFRQVIPLFDNMVKNISKLLRVGNTLSIPLIATEQYPQGLGKTVKELSTSHASAIIPKSKFTTYLPETECYIKELMREKPKDVVIFGLETHICILQSCIDFLKHDFNVHVVADCVGSRMFQDRDVALCLLRQIGCFVQTSESVIFNLIHDKEHPNFDDIRKSVKEPSMEMALTKIWQRPEKDTHVDKIPPVAEPITKPTPEKAPVSKTISTSVAEKSVKPDSVTPVKIVTPIKPIDKKSGGDKK